MIDIHCHILPGVDDGAKNEDDFLAMAKAAVAEGITTAIATPHHMNGNYTNPKDQVLTLVDQANSLLKKHNIPLHIQPGQEIRIYETLVQDMRNQELLFLDSNTSYVLLELPHDSVPHYIDRLLFDIQVSGVTPIIPHPERNSAIRKQPNLLYRMVKAGALVQITAASLTGHFGKTMEKFCYELIDHHLVQLIATDAHNTGVRGYRLTEAYQRLQAYGGVELMQDFMSNAQKVVSGTSIWSGEPIKFQKKKIFGIF